MKWFKILHQPSKIPKGAQSSPKPMPSAVDLTYILSTEWKVRGKLLYFVQKMNEWQLKCSVYEIKLNLETPIHLDCSHIDFNT